MPGRKFLLHACILGGRGHHASDGHRLCLAKGAGVSSKDRRFGLHGIHHGQDHAANAEKYTKEAAKYQKEIDAIAGAEDRINQLQEDGMKALEKKKRN